MIERMKKATVIVLDSRRKEATAQLRDAGVLHVNVETRETETLAELQQQRRTLERAGTMFPPEDSDESARAGENAASYSREGALRTARTVLDLGERLRGLQEDLDQLVRAETAVRPWGDFNPADLEMLQDKGVEIRLYMLPAREFRAVHGARIFTIAENSSLVLFAAAYLPGEEHLDIQPVVLPDKSLSEMQREIEETRTEMAATGEEIAHLSVERGNLQRAIDEVDEEITFEQVRGGMESAEPVAFLTGYVPESELAALRQAATESSWGLLIRDPDADDPVPTRIKNPKAVSIIQPVFDLLGTVPGYHELDISFPFLVFFSGFFAMIIGDGGYGMVLLLFSIFGMIQSMRKNGHISQAVILMTVLSVCTVAWGAVTGTWFGYEGFAHIEPFSSLVVPQISSFNPRSAEVIQWICFVIGTVQLSIAHIWTFIRGIRQRPAIKAFAQLGWLVAVLGLYYLVLTVVLGQSLPEFAIYMILSGMGVVVIFSQQEAGVNFFKGILKGIANIITTALDGVSAFSDIISYIRLFAVGLASVEIAKSFNSMASGLTDTVIGMVAAVLILFLGHTLNLAMGALAVIVHGVRLNMLEFSSHLGMEWSGVSYKPFQKQARSS